MVIKAYVDGACRGNPGPGSVGVVIYDKLRLFKNAEFVGDKVTNNQAEYYALQTALYSLEGGVEETEEIIIHSDSEIVVKQMNGDYKINDIALRVLHKECKAIMEGLPNCKIVKVPREASGIKEADSLANWVLDRYEDKDSYIL